MMYRLDSGDICTEEVVMGRSSCLLSLKQFYASSIIISGQNLDIVGILLHEGLLPFHDEELDACWMAVYTHF